MLFPCLIAGKEETFRKFCLFVILIGILSYSLAVYQIFLGQEEDDIIDAGNAETGIESPSAKDNMMGENDQSVDPIMNVGKTTNEFKPAGGFKKEQETTRTRTVDSNIGMSGLKKSLANGKRQNPDCLTENGIELDIPYFAEETEESNTYEDLKTSRRGISKPAQHFHTLSTPGSSENKKEQQVIKLIGNVDSNMTEPKVQGLSPRGSTWIQVGKDWKQIKGKGKGKGERERERMASNVEKPNPSFPILK